MASLPSFASFQRPLNSALPPEICCLILPLCVPSGATLRIHAPPASNATHTWHLPLGLWLVAREWGMEADIMAQYLQSNTIDFSTAEDVTWFRASLARMSLRLSLTVPLETNLTSVVMHLHTNFQGGPAAFGATGNFGVPGIPFPVNTIAGFPMFTAATTPMPDLDALLSLLPRCARLSHLTWVVENLPASTNIALLSFVRVNNQANMRGIVDTFVMSSPQQHTSFAVAAFIALWQTFVDNWVRR